MQDRDGLDGGGIVDRLTYWIGIGALLALFLGAVPAESASNETTSPPSFIRTTLGDAAAAFHGGPAAGELRWQRLRTVLLRDFAVDEMGRGALGAFASTTPAERIPAYLDAFEDFLLLAFGNRITDYGAAGMGADTLDVTQPPGIGGGSLNLTVTSTLHRPDGRPVAIDWRLGMRDGRFVIVDYSVFGTSQAQTSRKEFASIIHQNGFQGLMDALHRKTAVLGKNTERRALAARTSPDIETTKSAAEARAKPIRVIDAATDRQGADQSRPAAPTVSIAMRVADAEVRELGPDDASVRGSLETSPEGTFAFRTKHVLEDDSLILDDALDAMPQQFGRYVDDEIEPFPTARLSPQLGPRGHAGPWIAARPEAKPQSAPESTSAQAALDAAKTAPSRNTIPAPETSETPDELADRVSTENAKRHSGTDTEESRAAMDAFKRGDYASAFQLFRAQAERGDPFGQYNMGVFYTDDSLGVPQDYAEAARWYRRAAEQGHVEAEVKLAVMYAYGYGVPKDRSETLKWFLKAAEQGDVDAQYNVGFMYRAGRDVARNDAEAAKWYRRAAEHGSRNAQAILGVMLAKGEGVHQNRQEAALWLQRAADNGHVGARYDLEYLRRMMSVRGVDNGEQKLLAGDVAPGATSINRSLSR